MVKKAKRMISTSDIFQITVLESPKWHPTEDEVIYVQLKPDQAANDYKHTIWRWREEWGAPRQFTNGGKMDFDPQYSPDGERVAFVSLRGGKPQIYLIRTDGGEAQAFTRMPNGVTGFSWSPDGKQIAFLSALTAEERRLEKRSAFPPLPPKDALDAKIREVEQEHKEKQRLDPRIHRGLPFKAGTDFVSDRYTHIFVVDVDDPNAKPRRLTDGQTDFTTPRWSPNGRYLWTTSVRKPALERFAESDVVRITVKTGESMRIVRPGFFTMEPKPSPDGKLLAAITMQEKSGFGHIPRLTVFTTTASGWRDLNLELDRSVGDYNHQSQFCWSDDSQGIYCTIQDSGYARVFYVDLASGKFSLVTGTNELIQTFSVNGRGDIAFVGRTVQQPPELYITRRGLQPRRVTKIHDEWLKSIRVAPTEEIRYTAPDGQPIQGWMVKPPDFNPKEKWPLAVNVHGGPHVMWSPAEHAVWLEWQLHAARGYVVFFCNPRGSDGYGDDFRSAIQNNWGQADMPDILSGVEAVVGRGYIDEKRMALTGGSYGGYMTAWIVGHDNRFAAAVAQRGVYNLMSFYGTSDVPRLIEGEFETMAFDDPEKMWHYSPFSYVRKMRTPLLLIHSDNDYRVPVADAEQMFTALKKLRRTVEFARYPREGHELSRSGEPEHRIDRLERMTAWFDKYCKPRKIRKK
ncbi:MAG: S9 family peptidase [Anaerolineales bacterium]|nr:S9 family peptidase [Anaerolineales bacterium]